MPYRDPRFSIITPVFNTPPRILGAAIESVEAQSYTEWEMLIVDDGSSSPDVRRVLEDATDNPRVKVWYREEQGGIVAASNDAIDHAIGEFVVFLDHDDELHPHALERVSEAIDHNFFVDYVYSDEDNIDMKGRRSSPFYKPDWSPDRFRCQMYTCHLSAIRLSLLHEVGGLRAGFDGAQDYDLVLRVTEKARKVVHIPEVLYHWRTISTSVAGNEEAKPWAFAAGTQAIAEHLERTGFPATVEHDDDYPGLYRLTPQLDAEPLVSVVIPTAGTRRVVHGLEIDLVVNCVEKLMSDATSYRNLEIVCVVDRDTPESTRRALMRIGGPSLKLVEYDEPFDFSKKINLGVLESAGDYLLLLNDDIEPIAPNWIESMLSYALDDNVGAVGAKLLFADGRIQHAGVVGVDGNPGHCFRGFSGEFVGHAYSLLVPCNYLMVTAACMMTKRHLFTSVGGFSEDFPINYNDVDYCLKVHSQGLRIVYDPGALLYHFENSSRPDEDPDHSELTLLHDRWGRTLKADPYYNPNFLRGSAHFNHREDTRLERFRTRTEVVLPRGSRRRAAVKVGVQAFEKSVDAAKRGARRLSRRQAVEKVG